MKAYKELEARYREIMTLREVVRILDWDQSVMMPVAGAAQRRHQLEVMSVTIHKRQSDPVLGEMLAKTDRKMLDPWQAANVELMERLYTNATALSADLLARKINQSSKTEMIWRQARAESKFSLVADDLARLLDIVREEAAEKSSKLGLSPYDALMDGYAPYMTSAEVDAIFDDIADFTPAFLDEVLQTRPKPKPIASVFPAAKQEKLAKEIIQKLGATEDWCRLDVSAHPFSTGMGNDVRLTTRYGEDNFTISIQAAAHEAGHGLYDHHTPPEWSLQPVGISQYMGMAIHESQSLSVDMQLARSRDYWEHIGPMARVAFGGSGDEWSNENQYLTATEVKRGCIRIEADEVTYPAHIILRYRLEKAMVAGTLEIKDLPDAWNAGLKELIGIEPPDDRRGCLQDIHWHFGAFGYFPAYALGAIIAAQMVDKMKQDMRDLSAQIQGGDFSGFVGWLRDNVQQHGCLYRPQDLIKKATGSALSTKAFKKHLTARYLGKEYTGSKKEETCSATSAPEARRQA